MELKQCRRCGNEYPKSKEFFDVSKYYLDGRIKFSSRCKLCLAELKRQKRQENPEHFRAIDQNRHERNKPERNARSRKYQHEHRDELLEKGRQRRLVKRDQYNMNKREKYRTYADAEQRKATFAAHRTRKAKAPGKHTKVHIRRQLQLQNRHCFWCSAKIVGTYHVDHIIPLSRGGSNWPANICITCAHCNSSKSDKMPFTEWTPPQPLLEMWL